MKKIVVFLLIFNLVFQNSIIVYAEELSPSATPVPSSSPEPSLDESITSSSSTNSSDQSITTGEADSQSESSTQVNTNINNAGEDTVNQNQANTSDSNQSNAQTGQNTSTGGGAVDITTGNATASSEVTNQVNTNIENIGVGLTAPLVGIGETTPHIDLSIINQNDATVTHEATVSASTGENIASNNSGNVNLISGEAVALGNIFDLVNTNIVGSNFQILYLNLTDQQGDINLFQMWKLLLEGSPLDQLQILGDLSSNSLTLLINNENQAEVNNNLSVTAVSGKNEASNNQTVNLNSGNATALANVTNVVNTNIAGSKFLFVIINMLDSYQGDLILPRKEYFPISQDLLLANNQNSAIVEGSVTATSDSGNNEVNNTSGDSALKTGESTAFANSISFINQSILSQFLLNFFINNLGSQEGQVLGWSSPEASEHPSAFSLFSTQILKTLENLELNNSPIDINNLNNTIITNHISAEAISGQNKVNNNGSANLQTGNAKALANLFNFINLNITGSNWFFGAANVLGNWKGNTIFAYPDVWVGINGPSSVMVGDEITYNINYKNLGYDDALNSFININLPNGTSFVSDSSGITSAISGNNIKWNLGDLSVGKSGSFSVKLKLDSNYQQNNIVTTVNISTSDPQSNSSNDSSSIITFIQRPTESSVSTQQQENTTIEIKAQNNVTGFVYQGGTILFNIEVKNTGNAKAKNVVLVQAIYNSNSESTGNIVLEIGDIEVGKTAKIDFAIELQDTEAGFYSTIAQAFGENISANEATTYFEVRKEEFTFVPTTQVLAEQIHNTDSFKDEIPQRSKQKKNMWPWAYLIGIGGLSFANQSIRRKLKQK